MVKDIIILCILLFIISGLCGCSGLGLNKQATLVPDRFGISVGQSDNENCPDGWPTGWHGITVSFQWDLK